MMIVARRYRAACASVAAMAAFATVMLAAQAPAPPGSSASSAGAAAPSAPMAPVQLGAATSSLAGGVPSGSVSAQPIALGLDDAIQRGLRYNLAALLASNEGAQARATRLAALSALLPQVAVSADESRQKINLAAYGISIPGIPLIVGPFNVFGAQATGSETLSFSALEDTRAARSNLTAAREDLASTRNLVVVAVVNQYLLAVADSSRVQSVQAELDTAQQSLQQAEDMFQAGTVDALQRVRAEVERDQEHQRLIAAQNDLAMQMLTLARAIGLPPGQQFTLADTVPYAPFTPPAPATAIAQALAGRPDYRAAQAAVLAAQFRLDAVRAQRLPSLGFSGSWGTLGHEIDSNHGVFSVAASLSMPVFTGGALRAQEQEAAVALRDDEDRVADLRASIDNQVRTALLTLNSSAEQVAVARSARDLAQQELGLSRDRFAAGVADNLEVVQAQQTLAGADESFIQSLYAYNLAKAELAQALGTAESSYRQYLLSQ